jgi:glycine/D-amino acid oxidase-like deaminating enzyme
MGRAVKYTLDLLREFRGRSKEELGLHTPGSLHLALSEERLKAFRRQIPFAKECGIETEIIDPAAAQRIAPSIDPRHIHAAIFVHGDGYVDARQAALAYAAAAGKAGAEFLCGTEVTGFLWDGRGAIGGLATTSGAIEARHVVLAAGPWTAQLVQRAGFSPPALGIRLQQARTVVDPRMPADHPVVRIPDASCYLRPERGGYLFGFFDPGATPLDPRDQPPDFRTSHIPPPKDVVAESVRRLEPIFPVLQRLAIDEYRQGIVTCSPDGWYVLGPLPGQANLWLATSCGAMGIAGSGAVGKWLAAWIATGSPGEDLAAMDPARYAARALPESDLRAACRRTFADYYSLQGGATYGIGAGQESASH